MKFLADENLELKIVEALRSRGFDVETIEPSQRSASDPMVLAKAREEGRILLTNDKDFAELAFRRRLASSGIVLIRLPKLSSAEKAAHVVEEVVALGDRLAGMMTVLEQEATRRRALPSFTVKGRHP